MGQVAAKVSILPCLLYTVTHHSMAAKSVKKYVMYVINVSGPNMEHLG